jgi:cytochrome c553
MATRQDRRSKQFRPDRACRTRRGAADAVKFLFKAGIVATALIFVAPSAHATKLPNVFSNSLPEIPWAFYVPSKVQPALHQSSGLRHVPGSVRTYTQAQIDNLMDPPDWYPDEHPPMPKVVAHGAPGGVFACASCHLASGIGHPESANLAGLSVAYIERQLRDFKDGRRVAVFMPEIAKNLTDEDAKQAATWFSQLPPKPSQKVVETDRVPKTFVDEHFGREPLPGGGDEYIGARIIEVPEDVALVENRDPHSGYIAYVPKGSIKRGRDLVATGGRGKTIRCAVCHGPALTGLGEVPPIAGRDPLYLVRQLYSYKHGLRNGSWSPLMRQVVASLSLNDMLNIAAYVGSLKPPSAAASRSIHANHRLARPSGL